MRNKYHYKYRRTNNKQDTFLIEFFKGLESENFLTDLKKALRPIKIKIESKEDLWMNDEVLFHFTSTKGKFTLSRDIWGLAFIISDENQVCIHTINKILNDSELFIQEEI